MGFNVPISHRIIAGCDIMLMPSRFEPCGLNQLFAMRYGTVPVAHATGGLRDTIQDFNPFAEGEMSDPGLMTLHDQLGASCLRGCSCCMCECISPALPCGVRIVARCIVELAHADLGPAAACLQSI